MFLRTTALDSSAHKRFFNTLIVLQWTQSVDSEFQLSITLSPEAYLLILSQILFLNNLYIGLPTLWVWSKVSGFDVWCPVSRFRNRIRIFYTKPAAYKILRTVTTLVGLQWSSTIAWTATHTDCCRDANPSLMASAIQ